MSDVISVDFYRLTQLAKTLGDVADSLDRQRLTDVNLDGSPKVRDAYSDFLGDWKKTRKARIQAITTLEEYLVGVVECLSQLESQLSDQLTLGS